MKPLSLCFVVLFACATSARAWLRVPYEDETIVQRAELIAIGHLKGGSVQYFPHENKPYEGKSWEHHAIFVITEIIKGKSDNREVPIIIHYGLEPVVGGHVQPEGHIMDLRGGAKNYPTNLVQIFDISGHMLGGCLVEDASKDNIWFLRRGTGIYGWEPGTNDLGIVDPGDLQPLKLRSYFEAYLSANPESVVKSYASEHPDVAARAQRYLDHLEVQRILKIADPTKRFDALLPHYLNQEWWGATNDIRNGLVSCGNAGGEKLCQIFDNPNYKDFREEIILMWRDMNYTNAAPLLVNLLQEHDRFWDGQTLTNGWWNTDVGSEVTQKRRAIYGEIYYSVAVLRTFHDAGAKQAIELTQKRWKSIKSDNPPQILQECDAALKEFAGTKGSAN